MNVIISLSIPSRVIPCFSFLVYVEQGRSTTATTLTFTTASTSGITWKAKVSQIECSSTSRGDPDCNQYITGASGTVNSYNWPTVQLASKTANICIRRELGKYFSLHGKLYQVIHVSDKSELGWIKPQQDL